MAERADVYVRNTLKENIKVQRSLSGGGRDSEQAVPGGKKGRIQLSNPEVGMMIETPGREETKNCFIKMRSDVDLDVSYSRTRSRWLFKISPNDLPPDAPTSVTVEVGEEETDIVNDLGEEEGGQP